MLQLKNTNQLYKYARSMILVAVALSSFMLIPATPATAQNSGCDSPSLTTQQRNACRRDQQLNVPARTLTECQKDQQQRLLGIVPKWYKYLPYQPDVSGRCAVHVDFRDNAAGILPIGLAIIEMLLAIAGTVSVVFVMVGGFRYITSQGEPEHTKAAQSTIINALIGGAIAILATALVTFIGGRFN